ncbi:hypothetical protein EMIHUDRAFT_457240 [Emiliania huxleyi CCMP1516]|uniref:Major facilitator superfamily (MFS) profile domain-containing protein n=2 Tax=Emiliania huxleyi TaxID=2903 RepID=A0A0D3JTY5_EMIH1|nr:hypothetical protein EMIHUDRAFT_457240 [Emiliania huxleyi CCMP1516]EOD26970.1 hypothetical protein EMIHUDRAFT_457240 [Emiliania huxleyi CCMP1516]|eukprot:XP_005779399.1 hypothetical protein EMIHUDRAFT_457240 [Emiliania huxleyi CCMP1516]
MFVQQFSGINAVIFYSASILQESIGQPWVVMTAVAVLLMDRAGRRALLLVSLAGMCFCAAAMGAFHLNAQRPTWLAAGARDRADSGAIPWLLMGELFAADVRALAASMATLLNWAFSFTMTLVFAQLNAALGPAGTPLPLLGHLGQSRVISGHLGPAGTFFLFSAICAAGAAFVAACLPETKGRSLAEVQALFGSEAS